MIAAKHGSFEVLQLLIENNADTRIQDEHSKTALDFAKEGGWKKCFDFLVQRSGKKRFAWYLVTKSFFNRFSSDSELGLTIQERNKPTTYFFSCIKKVNFERAKKLLLFGAHINAKEKIKGETVLHVAARGGNLSMIKFLLQRGALCNPLSKKGETPLHVALRNKFMACAKYLISFGANINARDQNGNTMLHKVAQEQDSIKLLKSLIEHKAHIEAKNKKGETPLWIAFRYSRMNAVNILLKAGANINEKNLKGETILHDACHKDNYFLVRELLKFKQINLKIHDEANKIPLHIALHNGHKQILDELLKHTDKMDIKDFIAVDNPITNKLIKKLMKPKDGECIICYEECVGYMIPCPNTHPDDMVCYKCVNRIKETNKCPTCRESLYEKLFNELCYQHENQVKGLQQFEMQTQSEVAVKS